MNQTQYLASGIKDTAVLGGIARGVQQRKEKIDRIHEYNKNPILCKNCQIALAYDDKTKNRVFCSHTCSATYNNSLRTPPTTETKRKVSLSLKKRYKQLGLAGLYFPKYPNGTKFRSCIRCNAVESIPSTASSKYCDVCRGIIKKENGSIYGKKSAAVQSQLRRSKNEILFSELCSEQISKNIKINEPMFNGWDADIILLEYKVAVLWNGNWHHKKITKKHSVLQVQTRDKIKLLEIDAYGYQSYVINDFGKYNPKFVKQEFEKFKQWLVIRPGVEK